MTGSNLTSLHLPGVRTDTDSYPIQHLQSVNDAFNGICGVFLDPGEI